MMMRIAKTLSWGMIIFGVWVTSMMCYLNVVYHAQTRWPVVVLIVLGSTIAAIVVWWPNNLKSGCVELGEDS